MDFFGFLAMLGGLSLFLFGMSLLGEGLTRVSGGKLEGILEKLTSSPIKAVLLGAGVTAIIQSSSATTVMVVGFVNSGIMKLSQSIGIIMGANIGTTMTAWILSLTGIHSDNFFINLLKPTSFSPILALVGVGLLMFSKKDKLRNISTVLLGFAVLMFGMDMMTQAIEPLSEVPAFRDTLVAFSNPILGMLVGAIVTAIIQSSSASVGMLQAICATGAVTYATAIPIIMGQNIGTCVTALLSSIGAEKNARRAALVHLYFNIIGTCVFLMLYYIIRTTLQPALLFENVSPVNIAVIHSLFNVATTFLLLPFSSLLEKLAYLTIKKTPDEDQHVTTLLEDRFIEKPSLALDMCKKEIEEMMKDTKKALYLSIELLFQYSKQYHATICEIEEKVDRKQDAIGSYLMRLKSKTMSQKDTYKYSLYLNQIVDLERIADHAVNLSECASVLHEKNFKLSNEAGGELQTMTCAIQDMVDMTFQLFIEEQTTYVKDIEPMEEVIDRLMMEERKRHMKRLQSGLCPVELGFLFQDILTNYERISDHCSNIALCFVEVNKGVYDVHQYVANLRTNNDQLFEKRVNELYKLYELEELTVS